MEKLNEYSFQCLNFKELTLKISLREEPAHFTKILNFLSDRKLFSLLIAKLKSICAVKRKLKVFVQCLKGDF